MFHPAGKEMQGMRLTILGSRGSLPSPGKDRLLFGGDTSCLRVSAGGDTLFLDAGTGLLQAEVSGMKELTVLLSHTHIDHVMGLAMFAPLYTKGCCLHIYGHGPDDGMPLQEQVGRLLSPPLWPVRLEACPAHVHFHDLTGPENLGKFQIDWMPSCHPGGAVIYRLRAQGRTLVYATDFEHEYSAWQKLIQFADRADLLLYDAQYTQEEYERHRGYGHSTAEMGIRTAEACHASRLVLIHHAPWATDEMLLEREKKLGVHYARQGETVEL